MRLTAENEHMKEHCRTEGKNKDIKRHTQEKKRTRRQRNKGRNWAQRRGKNKEENKGRKGRKEVHERILKNKRRDEQNSK